METEKKCGCKGIRTCLICENEGKLSKSCEENKVVDQYLYCPHCNMCWPLDSDEGDNPLYLGRLIVIPDFIAEDEEADIITAIDSLEWMPSQSGRKKQDFGPKVNFKKKKGKIGDFKGFPRFTENLIKRLEQHKDLSDFKPVELCHLDYDPDRGSAIEPHIDDSWIWGERLVTINLASPTILTFTPANRDANCDCRDQCLRTLSKDCKHRDVLDERKNYPNCPESNPITDMCTEKRIKQKTKNFEVMVPLPPRSLVVVAGCCRHNWFHEIKRKDIVSRRLAMTFRELSWNFMPGGPDEALGTELMGLGRTFWDRNLKWE